MNSRDKLIKAVMDGFDFKKVHKAMKALNWEWYLGVDQHGKANMGIPSLQTIKNKAIGLLSEAYEEKTQVSTGGFWAEYDGETLLLEFVVSMSEESSDYHI